MKSIYLSDVRADLMVKSSRCRKPHQRDRVWHYWGKLHHRSTAPPLHPSWSCCHLPWVAAWRAFTLLNAAHMLLHLSPYWPPLPALPDWPRLSSIIRRRIGLASGSVVRRRSGSDLGLLPSHRHHTPQRAGGGIKFPKTNRWVFSSAVKSST